MNHQLSCCEIEQLSENVFEKIPKPDIVIDRNCANESWIFWHHLRKAPFGLLVNFDDPYYHTSLGSREILTHPLQQKTAILLNNAELETEFKKIVKKKEVAGDYTHYKIFTDRDNAIDWLSAI